MGLCLPNGGHRGASRRPACATSYEFIAGRVRQPRKSRSAPAKGGSFATIFCIPVPNAKRVMVTIPVEMRWPSLATITYLVVIGSVRYGTLRPFLF
jgi:hypothetical protein